MPKSYYQDKWATIFLGDCLEIMPKLEPVDLVVTDPDYNAKDIGPNQRHYVSKKCQSENYPKFCSDWFGTVQKLTENIVFTPGIANTHFYPQPYWILCWHKPAAVSFNRLGGYNAWEPIFIYGKPFKRLPQDYLLHNVMNLKKGPERKHPCPKPLSLLKDILFKLKDGLILDPFIGSGTTLLAAKQLNRKSIGIEIEEKYCEIAVRRLSQEVLEF